MARYWVQALLAEKSEIGSTVIVALTVMEIKGGNGLCSDYFCPQAHSPPKRLEQTLRRSWLRRGFSQGSMIFDFLHTSVWWCSLGFVADGKKISAYMFVFSPPYLWQWCGGGGGGGGGGVPKKIAARWNKGCTAIIGNLLHNSATSMKRGNCWGWQKPTNLEGHEKEKWLTEICWRLHI